MIWRHRLVCAFVLVLLTFASRAQGGSGCVWKVTSKEGGKLYLGGSIHALRSTDYPLPSTYNQAFEASSRLALEIVNKPDATGGEMVVKAGRYPKNDSLKNHVDPRTYDYVRRIFGLLNVPEAKIARCRPWLLILFLNSAGLHGNSDDLGVDSFLERRAKANHKPIIGLESFDEHLQIFSGLNDRQAEALLLLGFIPQTQKTSREDLLAKWRRGDVDGLAAMTHDEFQEFPAFGNRLLDQRNRNWIPKIERELHSGKTCFVVVGAAHLGGPAGLLTLLRTRGYRVEQL